MCLWLHVNYRPFLQGRRGWGGVGDQYPCIAHAWMEESSLKSSIPTSCSGFQGKQKRMYGIRWQRHPEHTHTHSKQCGRTDLSIGQIMTPFHFSVARLERPNLSCPVILVSDASVCYRLKVPTTAWRAGATVTQMEWKVKQKSFDKLHWDGRSSAKLGGGDATPSLYPSLGPFAAAADAVRYLKNITAPSTAAINVTQKCVLKRSMAVLD